MPQFDNGPPKGLGRSGLRLIRTPAARPVTGYVLSNNLLGCRTHYVGNRTVPCESPSCDACEAGVPWRWHGYLALQLSATTEVVILEITAQAATVFQEYYERHGTLHGAAIKATRLNNRPNGRVIIHAKPADLAKINLPNCPNVAKLLCHIWNVPEPTAEESNHMSRPPARDLKLQTGHDAGPPTIGDLTRFHLHAPGGNGNGNGKGAHDQ